MKNQNTIKPTQEKNKYLQLDKPSFGTPEWDILEKEIHDRRRLYEAYGIGTEIATIDGEGSILSLYGRAIEVSLKIIKSTQVLHGFSKGNGGLHRTYLFKDYYCPLLLTPLLDITDEDAIEVAIICGYNKIRSNIIDVGRAIAFEKSYSGSISKMTAIIDFLRSKGYALPWMGYSVEQLISFGWLKLKQKGGEGDIHS